MAPFRSIVSSAFVLSLLFGCESAFAITAKDVIEKMSKQQQFDYLSGLIDMRAYQALQGGDAALATCINASFYEDKQSKAWLSLIDALGQFGERQPAAIVSVLTGKVCSK